MAELPIPPDPTPEEVAFVESMVAGADALAAFVAQFDLDPEQRRKLNSATRAGARARQHLADIRRRQG